MKTSTMLWAGALLVTGACNKDTATVSPADAAAPAASVDTAPAMAGDDLDEDEDEGQEDDDEPEDDGFDEPFNDSDEDDDYEE